MSRIAWLLPLVLLAACPEEKTKPKTDDPPSEPAPPPPRVDLAFVQKAMGPGFALANHPLVDDLDPRPGVEALVAIHQGGKRYQVAVVRGDHQVLARAPLAGKVLGQTDLTWVGDFRPAPLLPDGKKAFLMPIETLVYHRSVCGILAFRYRAEALSVVGEFSTRCWRKEAGGEGGDPFSMMSVKREGDAAIVETKDEGGETSRYTWDATSNAFSSPTAGKSGAKQR